MVWLLLPSQQKKKKNPLVFPSLLFWKVPPFKEILDREDICLEKCKYNENSSEKGNWVWVWVSGCLITLAPWSLIPEITS